ncbi:MAG: disulfide bond formation protein B [Robiginitomaculum sp.]|nr:disulfide bond formation protein B [Robiginitomaculum sp.]
MTKKITTIFWQNNAPCLAILLSGGLWLGALAFEHIGGYHPCQMCYWQRHAHKAVLAVAILALCVRHITKTNKWDRGFLALIGFAFLISFYLAFWHMGVEYKWWEGPKTCSAAASALPVNANDISSIFEKGVKLPACSDAPWHLFTISMAGYNALFSGLAALLSFIFVVRWKNV